MKKYLKLQHKNKKIFLAIGLSTIATATSVTLPIVLNQHQKTAKNALKFDKMNLVIEPIANVALQTPANAAGLLSMYQENYFFSEANHEIKSLKAKAAGQLLDSIVANIKAHPSLVGITDISTYSGNQLRNEINSWFDFADSHLTISTTDHKIGATNAKIYPYRSFIYELKIKKIGSQQKSIKIPVLSYIDTKASSKTTAMFKKLEAALKYEITNSTNDNSLANLTAYQNSNLTSLYNNLDENVSKLKAIINDVAKTTITAEGMTLIQNINSKLSTLVSNIANNLEQNQKGSLSWIKHLLHIKYASNTSQKIATQMALKIKIENLRTTLANSLPKLTMTGISGTTSKTNNSLTTWIAKITNNLSDKSTTTDEIVDLKLDLSALKNRVSAPLSYTYQDLAGNAGLTGTVQLTGSASQVNLKIFKDHNHIKDRLIQETTAANMLIQTDFNRVSRGLQLKNLYTKAVTKIVAILKRDYADLNNNHWNKSNQKPYEIFYQFKGIKITKDSDAKIIVKTIEDQDKVAGATPIGQIITNSNRTALNFELPGQFGYEVKASNNQAALTALFDLKSTNITNVNTAVAKNQKGLIFGIDQHDYDFLTKESELMHVFDLNLADDAYSSNPNNSTLIQYNDTALKTALATQYNTTFSLTGADKLNATNILITDRQIVDNTIGSVVEMNVTIKDHGNTKVIYNLGKVRTHSKDAITSAVIVNNTTRTITWKYADGTIKSQVKVDMTTNYDMTNMGTEIMDGLNMPAEFKNRFYFTQIQFNIGKVIYNGVEQILTTAKIQNSSFYKANSAAFGATTDGDDEALVMFDKLTGQLYLLHSEDIIQGGSITVTYNQPSKVYTWNLGSSNGQFKIDKGTSNQNPRKINVTIKVGTEYKEVGI